VSGTQSLSSNTFLSSGSASRSLFAAASTTNHSASTIVCNTQDVSTKSHNKSSNNTTFTTTTSSSSFNKTLTPKASGRGDQAKMGRTSLFGSVMQQVGQPDASRQQTSHISPAKRPRANLDASELLTPRNNKRRFMKTPEKGSSQKKMPFGSPGGFELLDFVNNFGSPQSKHSHLSINSNISCASSVENEWHNTSLDRGIMDWSLPESLRFDCRPGRLVQTLLRQQREASSLIMTRFLQPTILGGGTLAINKDAIKEFNSSNGLAQWGAGLLYWQHPAIHPLPFVKPTSSFSKQRRVKQSAPLQENLVSLQLGDKNNRRSTLDLASSAAIALSEAKSDATKQTTSWQQQYTTFRQQRRAEWKQAFSSLYWKWISQVQDVHQSNEGTILHQTYFYARGTDHVILFQAVLDPATAQILPKITMTSSSAAFRDKLRQSGVETMFLLKAWNKKEAGKAFSEDMIRQEILEKPSVAAESGRVKPLKVVNDNRDNIKLKESSDPTLVGKGSKYSVSASHESPRKDNSKLSQLLSPAKSSNSPMVEDELAALRRAQVFGQTVGADVTITVKPKPATGPKIDLQSVPPLYVIGFDDCAAFFGVYLNLSSSCCVPFNTGAEKNADDRDKKNRGNNLNMTAHWKLPDDVPLLVCRNIGPFLHSTMKSLTVRGNPHTLPTNVESNSTNTDSPLDNQQDYASLEIQGGPILPCAILDCFLGLTQLMQADQQLHPLSSPFKTDPATNDEEQEEEVMVGSHNLILRAFPSQVERRDEDRPSARTGIVGSGRAETLNYTPNVASSVVDDVVDSEQKEEPILCPDQIRSEHVLGMIVWDIFHPHAMAYKMDRVASAASIHLFPN